MENPMVQIDPGLFIWTILTFLGLLGMLWWFAWGPLLKALQNRQETIRKSLEDADRAKQELERLQNESAEILRGARVEANGIIAKSRSDAALLGEELEKKARNDAEAIVRDAKRQIEMEKSQALREIRTEVADLSVTIASKLVERNLSREDNVKLVEDTLRHFEVSES